MAEDDENDYKKEDKPEKLVKVEVIAEDPHDVAHARVPQYLPKEEAKEAKKAKRKADHLTTEGKQGVVITPRCETCGHTISLFGVEGEVRSCPSCGGTMR